MDIRLHPLSDPARLEADWQALQGRADHGFFTSWAWVGTWLRHLPAGVDVQVLEARDGGEIQGLGLLTRGRARVFKALSVPCWRLMNTGVTEVDDLVVEYNDVLVARHQGQPLRQAMLQALVQHSGMARLELSHATPALAEAAAQLPRAICRQPTDITCHAVDLQAVRDAGDAGYLSLLSANTRAQTRRSLNAYAKLGALRCDVAADAQQGLAWLDELKALHTATWDERGEASSFAHSAFADRFHRDLLGQHLASGGTQLLRLSAGGHTLGFLYTFVCQGQVLYYQSGFRYGLLPKHDKPGVACHVLAVEHYARQGLREYNFMGGQYRYKASLATHSDTLQTLVLFPRLSLSHADAGLRQLKRSWQGVRPPAHTPAPPAQGA